MTKDSMNKYYIFREFIGKTLFIVGLYPSKITSKFYRFIPYINMLLHAYFSLGIIFFIHSNIKNLLVVISVSSALVSQTISIMKTICILIYRDDLLELLKISDKYFNSIKDSPRSADLFRNFSTSWYLLWILLGTGFLVCSTGTIPPIIYFIIDRIRHVKRHHYSLPIKVAYPWIPQIEGIYYVIHWMQQTYIGVIPVILTCSVEATFSLLVFRMISELRDMSYHIAHLDESNDQDNIIRNCINQYVALLKYRDSIQNIFGPVILQMFISNSIQLCAGVFVLSQLTPDAIHITFFTAYVVTKVAQTCLCAFAGSQLITESEDYKFAIYSINWHGNKRLMSLVLIALNQRPMNLVACHYTVISLNILVSIVNTTISYYFLLQTLQGN